MSEKDVVAIFFSKNRAMQAELAIRSFYKYCQDDNKRIKTFVLYKTDDDVHQESYDILINEYVDVNFVKETNFKNNLLDIIADNKYVLFCVDDTVWINNFNIDECINLINSVPSTIGMSFRLGQNTTYCYSADIRQDVPYMFPITEDIAFYPWTEFKYDYNYPIEVSSSLYRTDIIKNILFYSPYINPNTLEWQMYLSSQMMKHYYNLICYKTSRAFSIPMNRVQQTNSNRTGDNEEYMPYALAEEFIRGYRFKLMENFVPNSCHMEEVPIEMFDSSFCI